MVDDLEHALWSVILGFAALLACLFRAREASLVIPAEVLRSE